MDDAPLPAGRSGDNAILPQTKPSVKVFSPHRTALCSTRSVVLYCSCGCSSIDQVKSCGTFQLGAFADLAEAAARPEMNEKSGSNATTDEVKTCPVCRGTWPATRSHCLACGASLANVPARLPQEGQQPQTINWRFLDELSPEESTTRDGSGAQEAERSKRKWWEFWR
jgi:hypothetical protein